MLNFRMRHLVCFLCVVSSLGCRTVQLPVDDPLLKTPIIDVHTHTFNARYLPLSGIALGKRDISFFTRGVDDSTAKLIAFAISYRTPLPSLDNSDSERNVNQASNKCRDFLCEFLKQHDIEDVESFKKRPVVNMVLREVSRDLSRHSLQDEKHHDSAIRRTGSSFRKQVMDRLGMGGHRSKGEYFLEALLSSDLDKPNDYRHSGLYGENVRLMVSHMMDLGPVYNQLPGGKAQDGRDLFIDFELEQIPRMNRLQQMPDSDLIYFVGYNPFRDHWPSGKAKKGDALAIVTNAITNHGAFGVKIYPPSGYRPFNNCIPEKEPSAGKYVEEQWDARYEGVTSGMLDERLNALLEWCENKDIPVFTHCHYGEFEARKDYGVKMADPKWWAQYLDWHTKQAHKPGEKCRLRLCFGHAGGDDYWFGSRSKSKKDFSHWGEQVVRMCQTYENVYCEVGILSDITQRRGQNNFAKNLSRILKAEKTSEECYAYSISDKLMFGTDFYMPDNVGGKRYLQSYQKVFLRPELRNMYRQFFFVNAMNYLNYAHRDEAFPLPSEVCADMDQLEQHRDDF